MAENSNIEWCTHTWNPWTGCTQISPACDNCYAKAWSKRAGSKVGQWGVGLPRVRTSSSNWKQPIKWNRRAEVMQKAWDQFPGSDEDKIAAGFIKPTPPLVFCASLADWLDNEVEIGLFCDALSVIARTPYLVWLLLSKRIGVWRERIAAAVACFEHRLATGRGDNFGYAMAQNWLLGLAPAHVWIGQTICNQNEADRDISKLVKVPARGRFLSVEPMLGQVNLKFHFFSEPTGRMRTFKNKRQMELAKPTDGGIHWVICGGESGHQARPVDPSWVRDLRDQCAIAEVPFLFKQWGKQEPGRVLDGAVHHNFPVF